MINVTQVNRWKKKYRAFNATQQMYKVFAKSLSCSIKSKEKKKTVE